MATAQAKALSDVIIYCLFLEAPELSKSGIFPALEMLVKVSL